jgi:Domain of Unknown Function (DUF1080)
VGPRFLSILVVIAVIASALALSGPSSARPAALVGSPEASPEASPVASPVVTASVDPGEATVAALETQIVGMSGTATAQAATQATIVALSTQAAGIAQTATAAAAPPSTETPTPEPTATPTDTPTATPLPQAGDVLYRTGKTGFKKWGVSAGWKYLDGMLVNDGTGNGVKVVAPFEVSGITDYAIEVQIQLVSTSFDACFAHYVGIFTRAQDTSGGGGYAAGLDLGCGRSLSFISDGAPPPYSDPKDSKATDIDNDWHTYRLEAKGNQVSLFIDGALVLQTTNNHYLDGGYVGLFCDHDVQVNVRSFKVIAL